MVLLSTSFYLFYLFLFVAVNRQTLLWFTLQYICNYSLRLEANLRYVHNYFSHPFRQDEDEDEQDKVNNVNSAFILINLLISQGCQSGLIGQGGPGGPDGPSGPGGPGGSGGSGSQGHEFWMTRIP